MWSAGFEFVGCRRAIVSGFKRRFWNYSYDHRGTCENPGLVVCAVETQCDSDIVDGLVLDIPSDDLERVLDLLDMREKCGYMRKITRAFDHSSRNEIGDVFIYCAYLDDPGIEVFVQPRNGVDNTRGELEQLAALIRSAEGSSGKNIEYLNRLFETLVNWGIVDCHIFTLYEICSQ